VPKSHSNLEMNPHNFILRRNGASEWTADPPYKR
jgi:hypothetical protein